MNTSDAAEKMLTTGSFYTAQTLGAEFGVSARVASGWLYNIRTCKKYGVIETPIPNRKVKVISINGKSKTLSQLQNLALMMKRPKLLEGTWQQG